MKNIELPVIVYKIASRVMLTCTGKSKNYLGVLSLTCNTGISK